MISSTCNLFHSQYASLVTEDSTSETLDTPLQRKGVPAQATASDSLSTRTVEPKVTNNYLGSSGFSSVFFDTRSPEYILLVKAIRVIEKGPAYNDNKLGPVSRKKMTVSQLRKMKTDLKVENDNKLRELQRITEKIASVHTDIRQEDITYLLEILSDFYSPDYFIECMISIMQKIFIDHCKAKSLSITQADIDEFKQNFKINHKFKAVKKTLIKASRQECGEIIELIYKIVLGKDDMGRISSFINWFLTWDMYCSDNIVSSCINGDGSHYCAPYFSPELPIKVALKSFGRLPHLSEREKEFLEMKKCGGNFDVLKVQVLHFNLLIGKDVNPELVVSRVQDGCQRFEHNSAISIHDHAEYIDLLQFLHTATVCVLEKSEYDARRLIECYEYFSPLQPSAGVLKNYMQARCEE
uniref:hypothetical protein n=1 Tax=Endozoicomonas sp. ONNA2 TaxID=2828741 RepID=UPI0021474D71